MAQVENVQAVNYVIAEELKAQEMLVFSNLPAFAPEEDVINIMMDSKQTCCMLQRETLFLSFKPIYIVRISSKKYSQTMRLWKMSIRHILLGRISLS